MSTITTHAPGTFCWPELATTDQNAAKKFYGAVFGWAFRDSEMGPGETYTIFTNKDREAAALYTLRQDQRKMNVPPHWANYVSVESVDASAKKAAALGGTVLMQPLDVMDHGRMAVLRDPQGGVFCLWEPKKTIGVGVLGEAGALCWTELTTTNTEKAKAFYTQLLPWKAEKFPGPMDYTVFKVAETGVGGMMAITPEMQGVPVCWTPYFEVGNANATTDKIKQLGGKVMVGPQPVPEVGTFAIVTDPQGAVFAIIQPPATR
jgi:predicted enzyme related to lactoylglutathione lyase